MYKLVIQDDEGKTWVVPLIRDELTIGRKEGNTIRLTERNVSRRHAKVIRVNGAITIEDLGSYNGIRVNGSRIDGKTEIKATDRVQIGDYLIEVKSEAVATEGPTAEQPKASAPKTVAVDSGAATVPVSTLQSSDAKSTAEADTVITKAAPEAAPNPVAPVSTEVATQDEDNARTEVAEGVRPVARFVVLSTDDAGREFELARPKIIIGRTEDNDICIDHRSISRHHAQVTEEDGRFTIVDLESSNGVTVNGEDYRKTTLRRGDLVDLGHVRLRFVEAGEDFLFGRDAHAVDLSKEESRLWLWLLFLALGVGAVIAMVAVVESRKNASIGDAVVADAAVVTPEAPPADASPVVVTAESTADLAASIENAAKAEDWGGVELASQRLLALDPENVAAQQAQARAKKENANQKLHDGFVEAVANRDLAEAAQLYQQLTEDSVYRVKLAPRYETLKKEYVSAMNQLGRRTALRGDCREQKRLAASVIWPEAAQKIMGHRCKSTTNPRDEPTDVTAANPETPKPDYEQSLDLAREAAKSNHFGNALRLCKEALVAKPGDQSASLVCAMAACNLRREADARRYYERLGSEQQAHVAQICLRNEVEL